MRQESAFTFLLMLCDPFGMFKHFSGKSCDFFADLSLAASFVSIIFLVLVHLAAEKYHVEILKFLKQEGCDLNAKNNR